MYISSILLRSATQSTMEDAREAINNGYGHVTICRADRQSRGRGRFANRIWVDDGVSSLLFTLIIKRTSYHAPYPPTQAAALALCRRLEKQYSLSPFIKWPNDVLLQNKKISGILVEAEGPYYLIGMGVNLLQTEFSHSLANKATSLALECGIMNNKTVIPNPQSELLPLVDEIMSVITCPPPVGEIESRLAFKGNRICMRIGDPENGDLLSGLLSGIREDGSLILLCDDGIQKIVYSGEIMKIKS